MKQIGYSAPAKIILSGEHAVVYGKPAVACAISLRLSVFLKQGFETDPVKQKIIDTVLTYAKEKGYPVRHSDARFDILSDIPIGRGLGSSAALSVASSAALLEYCTGKNLSPKEINNCAYRVEKLFHRNPSGVDVSASCFGGLIYYRKEFEFLKTISHLQANIPSSVSRNLMLIDSGAPSESTAEMVEGVGRMYNKNTESTEACLNRIEKISKRIVISFFKKDASLFKNCIRDNEHELELLGIVSRRTKMLLEKLGQWGVGKVTGAGGRKKGSGYILFYTDNIKGLTNYLTRNNIVCFGFEQAHEGYKKII